MNSSLSSNFLRIKVLIGFSSIKLQIARLVYTNSGTAILALALNAIHLLWKWPRNDLNSSGKV